MPTFKDFYFNSSTGKNRIHTRMCIPNGEVRAVVQIVHGIAEHIVRYDDFMSFLAANGFGRLHPAFSRTQMRRMAETWRFCSSSLTEKGNLWRP